MCVSCIGADAAPDPESITATSHAITVYHGNLPREMLTAAVTLLGKVLACVSVCVCVC